MPNIEYNNPDHSDSHLYMMVRRHINEQCADEPVDFNRMGLRAITQLTFGQEDIQLLDIGSNSGIMLLKAAQAEAFVGDIHCLEPDQDALEMHRQLPGHMRSRVQMTQGDAEQLPYADDSMDAVTLHNVIFRTKDPISALNEAKRVTKAGGHILISTNSRGHAHYRHRFVKIAAAITRKLSEIDVATPTQPANGFYTEDIPRLLDEVGGLKPLDRMYVSQDTHALISNGEALEIYMLSLRYAAADLELDHSGRQLWQKILDGVIRPVIEANIEDQRLFSPLLAEPTFADTIKRGMFVIRNDKNV